jgi:hypothetical protein
MNSNQETHQIQPEASDPGLSNGNTAGSPAEALRIDSGALVWTKDGDCYEASHDGVSFIVEKTYVVPHRKIPRAERWTLSVDGPWYACTTKPTRKACYEAAERFLVALDVLEGRS